MKTPKHIPPKRQPGWGSGKRKLDGEAMDVAATAQFLGASPDFVRSRAARGLLPYRKWSGRLIFLRSEICNFLSGLEGVSAEEAYANAEARKGAA